MAEAREREVGTHREKKKWEVREREPKGKGEVDGREV